MKRKCHQNFPGCNVSLQVDLNNDLNTINHTKYVLFIISRMKQQDMLA